MDCPVFNYEGHLSRRVILATRVRQLLLDLTTGAIDGRRCVLDTRQVHHHLFIELTPRDFEYFAGHYRGEPFRCLKHYRVTIPSDPRVGVPPGAVAYHLAELEKIIQSAYHALDTIPLSRQERLRYLIAFVCRAFELFLLVHPYANGNGHVARLMVWCIFGRYGHWPRRWPVEPRPADPPYSDLIKRYRDGDKAPLEQFIASTLVP